ncbi:MAG: DnaD domain protein [Clostridia bacterium]|nr:DnaD domain protein [Clostridia bacterium]
MLNYRIDKIRVIGSTAFAEASKEELRALLALIELGGQIEDADELSKAALISPARCKAALAFWEESGVISVDDGRPVITQEFEDRLTRGEIDEVPALQVADSIRDESLASMIDECAMLMNAACLSNPDVKLLTALNTQYSLSPEYIVILAAHLSAKGDLTVRKLCNEAIRLSGKGCDTPEALDAYIKELEESSGAEWEFRRVLGIYGRNLSASEKKYFKKWAEEFGYSVGIVSEAYDLAVLNTRSGRGDLRYMDSVLTAWHEAGCKTVNDCRERVEADKAKRTAEKATAGKTRYEKSTPQTPRYGNFDINEAFNNAVARSFGEGEEEN